VRFSFNNSLNIEFDVTNTGSAPFYYNWPVEVALLDPETKKPVWKSTFDTDIRKWLPGEGWTDPDWTAVTGWSEFFLTQTGLKPEFANGKILPQKIRLKKILKWIFQRKNLYPHAGNTRPRRKFTHCAICNNKLFKRRQASGWPG
jgi:hypothetical protein